MAFWLNLTFKYYLSSLKIMEYSKDLKNFKDLDYLLGKDYIDGNYDLSKAILEKSASLLIEQSVTIQNRPFRDVYLVYNEKLEKDINEFIDNLKSSSLDYLDLLIGRDLYRLDSENYELSVIAKELKNDSLSYFWKYRKLKDNEVDFIENRNEKEELKKERLNQALELSKMADSHYLAYQIKKRSQVFFDDESNKVLFYLIRNNSDGINFLDMGQEELSNVYRNFKGRPLFIINKNDIYSIEYQNDVANLFKHGANNDKDSLIIGIINSKYDEGMYE